MKPEREWELRVLRYAATESIKGSVRLAGAVAASAAVAIFPAVKQRREELMGDTRPDTQDLGYSATRYLVLVPAPESDRAPVDEDSMTAA